MKEVLLLGAGGFIGTIMRYSIQQLVHRHLLVVFPLGTFIINITGCLLIGILYGIANRHTWLTPEWRLFLITGLCGGYTTFSAFSYEGLELLRQGNYGYFSMYAILSVVLGILATTAGFALIK
jgi:fluoride exporter